MNEPLNLKDHFPPISDEEWLGLVLGDLQIADIHEAVSGPPGGPAILPYYRRGASTVARATPGWRFLEFLPASERHLAASAQEAIAGGADGLLVPVGRGGHPVGVAELLGRNHAGRLVLWSGDGNRDTLAGLSRVRSARVLLDPAAIALETGASPDYAAAASTPHLGVASSAFAIDLTPWDRRGAPAWALAGASFAGLSEWMRALTEMGLAPDVAAESLHVVVPCGTHFFGTVALLRAIRLGTRAILEAYGVEADLPVLAITSTESLARVDHVTNLLRTTTSAAAAIVGGADLLSILPHDFHDDGGSGRGRRLARNIAHLLRHEALLDKVADPASGSWYVEALTEAVGEEAWDTFQEWEVDGGLSRCIESGRIEADLIPLLRAQRDAVLQGRQVMVGVNRFQPTEESAV